MDSDKLPEIVCLSEAEILTEGPWCHDSVDISVQLEDDRAISVEFKNRDKGEARQLVVPSVQARDVERMRDSLNYALQAENSLVVSFGAEQGKKHVQRIALSTEISEMFWLEVYKYTAISPPKNVVDPFPEHIRLRISTMLPGELYTLCGHKRLTHEEVVKMVEILDSWLSYFTCDD